MGRTSHWFAFRSGKRRWPAHISAAAGIALSAILAAIPCASRAASGSVDPVVLGGSVRADDEHSKKGQDPGGRKKKDDPGDGKVHPPTLADLELDLRAPRPEKRRSAVKKLAELDTRAAWDLVLKALADPDAMVADEAELALAGVEDRRLLVDLCGSAGLSAQKAEVRSRVGEALGRMSIEVDGEALLRNLALGAGEDSRTLVWSIERLAVAKKLGGDRTQIARVLERVCRSKGEGGLRGAALQALCALDRAAAQPFAQEALLEKDPALRCAGLLAAQAWTEVECTTSAQRLLSDPEPAVRAQATENLEKVSSKAAILALIERMDLEKRERLRYGILAFLQKRSGLAHGFDAAAWKEWAGKIVGAVTTGAAEGVHLGPVGDTRVAFAGLNVISDRVCFLIDCSGSLWQTKVGERTRKEIADAMLRKALEALPANTEFNLIPYTSEPFPWEKSLVSSRPENVRRALEFFERFHQTGKGNFFSAVERALTDPKVDTIVVLTDGAPTGGRHWHLDLMFDVLVERNRFRKVAFDSILVDASKTAQRKWSELAQRTGGRSTAAEMK